MSTAPIINMSSLGAGSAASKVGNAENSSGESFGDVLNREVNNSNNNGSGTSDVSNTNNQSNSANSSASSTSSTSSSSSSSSNSTSGANASGSTSSSTGASGKPGKTTSNGSNSANGSDPSNISSAQILALVNNVQLATSGANTTSSSTVPTDKSIGAIAATPTSSTGSASAIIGATISTTAGSDKTVVANTAGAASTFEAALKDAKLPTNATQSQQGDADHNTKSEQSSGAQLVLQNTAAPTTSLVLPTAAAEKSIQASVTQMDDAAIKVQQAVQTPQPSAVVATQQIAATEQFQANNSNNSLTPQVGSPAWDQALGQKVVWMVGGNQQSASLTLNPPDLGPMQVVLSVNNAHATVTFSSAQPEVRQALENAMPKLREMLGDAGIQLGQASINSGSAQQQNTSSQQNSGNSSQHTSGNTIDTIEAAAASVVRASPLSAGLGLVDTFA